MSVEIVELSLQVKNKTYLTPHYLRVYLEGENIKEIENSTIGVNNKICIPPKGVDQIYFPRLDDSHSKWIYPPKEVCPVIRTYTHKGVDFTKNEIWIDFVVHGTEGIASSWAQNAKEGDRLGVLMVKDSIELYKRTENYVLIGDSTAIPVISSILKDLPEEAKGVCIIEVFTENDIQTLETNASIEFKWIFNENPHDGSELYNTVKEIQLPKENKLAYIAAEYTTVKNLRHYLRKQLLWNVDEVNAYSYWKIGASEDKSEVQRRKEHE
ncbi:siderophore-interacting protein [Chryseobacterium oryctis]|uniref:Siderophore-interacting protein n=1 Tax=Chryseobacterium oryctis TaxID=2952618 RepID=A0ABT3HKH9_9FLAO|nr:siderophore-interacting protein [Chryseobacterium oryctis]MCW3160293.1 siderophore-interacting protein [Chryseobacterium oryctis]